MTTRVIVSCDGTWDDGRMPCRGSFPARSDHRPTAIGEAWRAGWDWRKGVGDLCPAHARAADEATAAHDLMRAGLPVPELDAPTAAWLTTLYGPDWPHLIPAPHPVQEATR